MSEKLPIQKGEMNADKAVHLFYNIFDDKGNKLVKSAKRRRLKEKMAELYYQHPESNCCTLSDGRVVAIIVCRQNPGRGCFCYFNNIDAPQDEIIEAFAKLMNMTCKKEQLKLKTKEEMTANEAKQFLDDIYINDKKITGTEKLAMLHKLFFKLYHSEENICHINDDIMPIVIKRKGINNKETYCLNTSQDKEAVLEAFATWVGCRYRKEKRDYVEPENKKQGELTVRQCARIFHNVPDFKNKVSGHDASPKIVAWFKFIGKNPDLNQVVLPDGTTAPIVVYRKSHAQNCWCLNTSDENVKPFVIERMAEISGSEICMDNIKISITEGKELYKTMMTMAKKASKELSYKKVAYYKSYAQKIYETVNPGNELTISDYLYHKSQIKEK